MLTPSNDFLSSLKLSGKSQHINYFSTLLMGATLPGRKIVITPAVRANPNANPPVLGQPEVSAPAIVPLKGWEKAITIDDQIYPHHIRYIINLPYSPNLLMIGETDLSKGLIEISNSKLLVETWVGQPASNSTTVYSGNPKTVEEFLYIQCKNFLAELPTLNITNAPDSKSSQTLYNLNGVNVPAIQFDLALPKNPNSTNYLNRVMEYQGDVAVG